MAFYLPIATILAALYLALAVVYFGQRKPGYSHFRHTISELGEVGSADGQQVSWGVFLPVGLVCLLVAGLVGPARTPQLVLAASIATGYVVAAIFPTDPGSPMSGTWRQALHNLGGGVQYLGGTLALFWLAESFGVGFRVAGFVVGAALLLVSFPHPARGLVQRIAETCLFGGLAWSLGSI
jgi:hypothetical protein